MGDIYKIILFYVCVNGRYVFRFNVNVLFGLILYIINYIKFIFEDL